MQEELATDLSLSWPEESTERLYCVSGRYFQFGGEGDEPKEVTRYKELHAGTMPPFMPLPSAHVCFDCGDLGAGKGGVAWPGYGPLPECVMRFIDEHGHLPPYRPIRLS